MQQNFTLTQSLQKNFESVSQRLTPAISKFQRTAAKPLPLNSTQVQRPSKADGPARSVFGEKKNLGGPMTKDNFFGGFSRPRVGQKRRGFQELEDAANAQSVFIEVQPDFLAPANQKYFPGFLEEKREDRHSLFRGLDTLDQASSRESLNVSRSTASSVRQSESRSLPQHSFENKMVADDLERSIFSASSVPAESLDRKQKINQILDELKNSETEKRTQAEINAAIDEIKADQALHARVQGVWGQFRDLGSPSDQNSPVTYVYQHQKLSSGKTEERYAALAREKVREVGAEEGCAKLKSGLVLALGWVWVSFEDEMGQGGLRIFTLRNNGSAEEKFQVLLDSPVVTLQQISASEVLVVTRSEIRKLSQDQTSFISLLDWTLATDGSTYTGAWVDHSSGHAVLGGLAGKALVLKPSSSHSLQLSSRTSSSKHQKTSLTHPQSLTSLFSIFKENLEVVDVVFGEASTIALLILNKDYPKLSRISVFSVGSDLTKGFQGSKVVPTHSLTIKEMFKRNNFSYPKDMKPVQLSLSGQNDLRVLFDSGLVLGLDFATSELISFILRPCQAAAIKIFQSTKDAMSNLAVFDNFQRMEITEPGDNLDAIQPLFPALRAQQLSNQNAELSQGHLRFQFQGDQNIINKLQEIHNGRPVMLDPPSFKVLDFLLAEERFEAYLVEGATPSEPQSFLVVVESPSGSSTRRYVGVAELPSNFAARTLSLKEGSIVVMSQDHSFIEVSVISRFDQTCQFLRLGHQLSSGKINHHSEHAFSILRGQFERFLQTLIEEDITPFLQPSNSGNLSLADLGRFLNSELCHVLSWLVRVVAEAKTESRLAYLSSSLPAVYFTEFLRDKHLKNQSYTTFLLQAAQQIQGDQAQVKHSDQGMGHQALECLKIAITMLSSSVREARVRASESEVQIQEATLIDERSPVEKSIDVGLLPLEQQILFATLFKPLQTALGGPHLSQPFAERSSAGIHLKKGIEGVIKTRAIVSGLLNLEDSFVVPIEQEQDFFKVWKALVQHSRESLQFFCQTFCKLQDQRLALFGSLESIDSVSLEEILVQGPRHDSRTRAIIEKFLTDDQFVDSHNLPAAFKSYLPAQISELALVKRKLTECATVFQKKKSMLGKLQEVLQGQKSPQTNELEAMALELLFKRTNLLSVNLVQSVDLLVRAELFPEAVLLALLKAKTAHQIQQYHISSAAEEAQKSSKVELNEFDKIQAFNFVLEFLEVVLAQIRVSHKKAPQSIASTPVPRKPQCTALLTNIFQCRWAQPKKAQQAISKFGSINAFTRKAKRMPQTQLIQLKNLILEMCSNLCLPARVPGEEPAAKLLHFEILRLLLQQEFSADLLDFKSAFREQFLEEVQATEADLGSEKEANEALDQTVKHYLRVQQPLNLFAHIYRTIFNMSHQSRLIQLEKKINYLEIALSALDSFNQQEVAKYLRDDVATARASLVTLKFVNYQALPELEAAVLKLQTQIKDSQEESDTDQFRYKLKELVLLREKCREGSVHAAKDLVELANSAHDLSLSCLALQILKVLDRAQSLKVERMVMVRNAWRGVVQDTLADLEVTKCLKDPRHLDFGKVKQQLRTLLTQNQGDFFKLRRLLASDAELLDLGLVAAEIARAARQKAREFGLELEADLQAQQVLQWVVQIVAQK